MELINLVTSNLFAAVNTYFNWGTKDNIELLIMYIFNFLSVGVGLVIVIGITYGGIQYSLAAGDQSKTKSAISTITNCVIALFLYLGMWALLNFLVPGGVFRW